MLLPWKKEAGSILIGCSPSPKKGVRVFQVVRTKHAKARRYETRRHATWGRIQATKARIWQEMGVRPRW
jgi:hypothetical protein